MHSSERPSPETWLPEYPLQFDILGDALPNPYRNLDAIIVPSARGAKYLGAAATLATHAQKPLVVMASGQTFPEDVADTFANTPDLQWHVVGVPPDYQHPLFDFAAQQEIPDGLRTGSDLSFKRNLGLCVAPKVFFIDDDITLGEYRHKPLAVHSHSPQYAVDALNGAASLLAAYGIVGFRTGGFPDKSMVHHVLDGVRRYHIGKWAYLSESSASYISGNTMMVNTDRVASHC